MAKKSSLVKIAVAFIFTALIVAGLYRDELPDVVANASMICYSCIGLK